MMRPSKRHRLEKKERQLKRRPRKRVDPLLGRRLIEEQKPRYALLAGAVVAMAGAMIWTIVALATSFSFQWLAIGIGAACGFAVGHFGRAVDRRFARMSAYFCILACVCGELLVAYALQLEIWLLRLRLRRTSRRLRAPAGDLAALQRELPDPARRFSARGRRHRVPVHVRLAFSRSKAGALGRAVQARRRATGRFGVLKARRPPERPRRGLRDGRQNRDMLGSRQADMGPTGAHGRFAAQDPRGVNR